MCCGGFKGIRKFIWLLVAALVIMAGIHFALEFFCPSSYTVVIDKYSAEYGLDRALVYSLIFAESKFDSEAVSSAGAKGLMQVMDATAEQVAAELGIHDFREDMMFDPEVNVRLGCYYLSGLIARYDGDIELTLAAYNAGMGRVGEWLRDSRYSADGRKLDHIPFSETRDYVRKVQRNREFYKVLLWLNDLIR